MKSLYRYAAAIALGIFLGAAGLAGANVTGQSLLTGPQDPSQLTAKINQLINSLNGQITNYIRFSAATAELGEMQISGNGNTWAANGTVATTMTSKGPEGAATTVQEWLVVFDTNGFKRFIPAY